MYYLCVAYLIGSLDDIIHLCECAVKQPSSPHDFHVVGGEPALMAVTFQLFYVGTTSSHMSNQNKTESHDCHPQKKEVGGYRITGIKSVCRRQDVFVANGNHHAAHQPKHDGH